MKPTKQEEDALRASVANALAVAAQRGTPLRELPLEAVHEGVTLRGRLYYWAKDWFCVLEEPFHAIGPGRHLLYAIPFRYVAPGAEPGEGLRGCELPGPEVLVEAYERALFENQSPSDPNA